MCVKPQRQVGGGPEILEELSESECRGLLEGGVLGRIAVVRDGIPRVFPVNYTLGGGDIVFRADEGMKLEAAEQGQVATFEVDHFDPRYRTGWSVMVTGVLSVISDSDAFLPAHSMAVRAWGAHGSRWVRLRSIGISGRRIKRQPPAGDG
jgi:nitroimidazol reductase NimA-like FMN-containing flavoprotein (pyridoxamine 5'-phosphate oxidase superfamily)